MRGEVRVTVRDDLGNTVYQVTEPNMICVGAAEVLVDGLTMSPSLSSISVATTTDTRVTAVGNILDTSNYVVQAISFGKSFDGYDKYAHNPQLSGYYSVCAGAVIVNTSGRAPDDTDAVLRSFNPSAVTGVLIPAFNNPDDTRLQMGSTLVPGGGLGLATIAVSGYEATANVGQNMNAMQFSATNGLGVTSIGVGCYPPDDGSEPPTGGIGVYYVTGGGTSGFNGFATSGHFEGNFNKAGVMDASGFINMTVTSIEEGSKIESTYTAAAPYLVSRQGLYMTAHQNSITGVDSTGFPGPTAANPHPKTQLSQIGYNVCLSGGDFALPNAYGGIHTMGLWCMDVKAMLANGLTAPFHFTALNNKRIYKLFAKKVFSRDITFARDNGTKGIINTFNTPFGNPWSGGGTTFSCKIQWRINF